MALTTSDCDAMRIHEHRMALITSGCAPSTAGSPSGAAAVYAGLAKVYGTRSRQRDCHLVAPPL